MSGLLGRLTPRGTKPRVEADDRYELAVLKGISDNEGWSDGDFTAALQQLAEEKKKNNACSNKTSITTDTTTTAASSPPAAPTASSSATAPPSHDRTVDVEKRQETVRITRQADSEGWTDDKTLAALRLRNSIHYELREKRKAG